jgi:hypothetical protein
MTDHATQTLKQMMLKLRPPLFGWAAGLGVAATLSAQVTNLTFELGVLPTNGSIMISESTNAVFVTITNAAVFTNITVSGNFGAQTNIQFLDNGRPPDQQRGDGTFTGLLITPLTMTWITETLELGVSAEMAPTDPPQDPPPPPVGETNYFDYLIAPRPFNDKFTNAFKVPSVGGVVTSSNTYASLEYGEPAHGQVSGVTASVWWNWSSGVSSNVLVDLGGSDFDAVLGVYLGASVTNLTEVASATNDVARRLKAHVNFNAKPGSTYRIAVAGYDTNAAGRVRLRLAAGALADTNGPIVAITSPPSESIFTSELVAFTGTAKEKNANESGVAKVLLQLNADTNLVTARGTENWDAVLTMPLGTNLVRAYGVDYNGNKGPAAAVVVRYVNPINDMFAQAILLDDVGGLETADNTYATKERGEPLHARNDGGHSVWYAWRAPFSGDLTLSTQGSNFDTLLAVYIGSTVTNLIELASNDDAFSGSRFSTMVHKVVANQLYYIAVDGFGGETGQLILSYSFTVTERQYGLTILSSLGGTVSPDGGLYMEGTRVLLTALPAKNFEFVQWEDASGRLLSTENPLAIIMDRNYTLAAKFRIKTYSDTFLSGDLSRLPWKSAGHAPWVVQTVDGQYAARSGQIADNQSSSLLLVMDLYAGYGAFDVKVSSEEGWDWLEFYLNGRRVGRWSGEVQWQTFFFTVAAGPNTLEWRYVKDANYGTGLDAAWIDNVFIPSEKPDPPSTRPSLSILLLPNRQAQITLLGQAQVTYVIQVSPDLKSWKPVSTNTPPDVAAQWIDTESPSQARRYYRAIVP